MKLVEYHVGARVQYRVRDRVYARVSHHVSKRVSAHVHNRVRNNVGTHVWNPVWTHIYARASLGSTSRKFENTLPERQVSPMNVWVATDIDALDDPNGVPVASIHFTKEGAQESCVAPADRHEAVWEEKTVNGIPVWVYEEMGSVVFPWKVEE